MARKSQGPRPKGSDAPFVPKGLEREAVLEGASVALRLTDGRIVVGVVVREHVQCVILRPWGGSVLRRFPWSSIVGSKTVGPHKWADRVRVAQRQRAGLSAV